MRRTGVPLGIVAVLLLATVLFAGRFHHPRPALPAPPALDLSDTTGRPVTLAGLRGRWVLVYFGYTGCHDDCTAPLAGMKEAADARHDVSALFVTVDPAHDTAPVLARFAAPFAPPVVALTGSPEAIAAAERAFGVYAVPHDNGGTVRYDRSNLIYVVDPAGRLAGHVDGLAPPGIIASTIGKARP